MQNLHQEKNAIKYQRSWIKNIFTAVGLAGILYISSLILWKAFDMENHPLGIILMNVEWNEIIFSIFYYLKVYVILNFFILGLAIGFLLFGYGSWFLGIVGLGVGLVSGYLLYAFHFYPALILLGFEIALIKISQQDILMLKIKYILNLFVQWVCIYFEGLNT